MLTNENIELDITIILHKLCKLLKKHSYTGHRSYKDINN